jgi:hypothetical protein
MQACPTNLAGVTGDAERTKYRRQTCRKLGSGALGTQMETHSSSIYFFSILSYSFFQVPVQNPKATLAQLLKSQSMNSHYPIFL